MAKTPEGIKLLEKELKPRNRAKLVASDEKRINEELEKCCAAHPGCRRKTRCHSLHNQVIRFIPYERPKREDTPPPRGRTGEGWIPQVNSGTLRASRERAIY